MCRTFRLWGDPDLSGVELVPTSDLPPDLPPLPFMNLLWEAGRLPIEGIDLRERAGSP